DLRAWIRCLMGVRLEILLLLSEGPQRVGDLVRRLDLGYTNISHALSELRRLRCIVFEREGGGIIYRLSSVVRVESHATVVSVVLLLPGERCATLSLPRPS